MSWSEPLARVVRGARDSKGAVASVGVWEVRANLFPKVKINHGYSSQYPSILVDEARQKVWCIESDVLNSRLVGGVLRFRVNGVKSLVYS